MKNLIKLLAITFSIVSLTNCSKEPIKSANFSAQGYLLIQSMDIVRDSGTERQVDFLYNGIGQLTRAEQQNRIFDFEYDDEGILLQVFTELKTTNFRIKSDSFAYDGKDRLKTHFRIRDFNSEIEFPDFQWRTDFAYQVNGKLKESTLSFSDSPDYERVTTYKWDGDNIEELELRDNNSLWFKANYEYDKNVNYQLNHPYFLLNEPFYSRNNATNITYFDIAPNIDLVCIDCDFEYDYNQNEEVISTRLVNSRVEQIINY